MVVVKSLNPVEPAELLDAAERYDEMVAVVDDHTLEIVERRRKTAKIRHRRWLIRRALALADVLGLATAFLVAELVFGPGGGEGNQLDLPTEFALFLLTLPVWILVAKLHGLYDHDEERTNHSTVDDLVGVFQMATVGAWIVLATAWLTSIVTPDFAKLFLFWGLALALVTAGRAVARAVSRRQIAYLQNTVIVGAGDVGQLIARKFRQHPEYGINVVGFVDARPKERREDLGDLAILGPPERLPAIVRLFDVERVVVAFSNDSHEKTLDLISSVRHFDVQIDVVPRLFEIVGPSVGIHTVEGVPLVGLPPARMSRSSRAMKRALDIVVAVVALTVSAPFFAYAAWRIRRESPGPVFFRQQRLGRGMKGFTLLKFRTMKVDTDDVPHREYIKQTMDARAAPGPNRMYKLDREDAVTPFGRWLRRTSLDELPQLINVLRGEMSLVGPRPCLEYETENFAPHHFERFLVPAGLTGLWQVTARARSTFGEALDMDVVYVRGWSLRLDFWLLVRTPAQLFGGTT